MEKNAFNAGINKEFTTIKPHHFLDYLYDLAINNRHDEPNMFGNNNGELCRKFIDGNMRKIKFTPFVDDICSPCKKLSEEKRCTDYFNDETTLFYGFRYKNDFNYQLDIKLNATLPEIFRFDKEQDMYDVLCALEKNLTEEIINLYLWQRPNRTEKTFEGIRKGKEIYKK